MLKKFFALCLAIIFIFPCVALAKKNKLPEVPPEKRVKILVQVFDATTFQELDTAEILCGMLEENFEETNIFNVRDKISTDKKFSELKTLGEKKSASDVGDLMIFNPLEVSEESDSEKISYTDSGADYVVKCTVLGLGTTQKQGDSFGLGNGIGVGIGRHHSFGIGIFSGISASIKRTFYSTAVNMKFIKADGDIVLFQRNLVGQARRHSKPSKKYDDASDEAYLKSIKNAAEIISERVTTYAVNHLIEKPKTDEKNKNEKKGKKK